VHATRSLGSPWEPEQSPTGIQREPWGVPKRPRSPSVIRRASRRSSEGQQIERIGIHREYTRIEAGQESKGNPERVQTESMRVQKESQGNPRKSKGSTEGVQGESLGPQGDPKPDSGTHQVDFWERLSKRNHVSRGSRNLSSNTPKEHFADS
jgi:hypothetical protein